MGKDCLGETDPAEVEREADDAAYKKQIEKYREVLVAAEQEAQRHYDKTLLWLSGGALGVSITFVKNIVGPQALSRAGLLLLSWIFWTVSLTCVLVSFYTSRRALRKTVEQVDSDKVHEERPGGCYTTLTEGFNIGGAVFFLLGVVHMIAFVYCNLR